ncbi:hypothetical protein E2320_022150, partial [Naja naja]
QAEKNDWAASPAAAAFWLVPPTSAKRMKTVDGLTRSLDILEDYYRPGDLIIGGNLPLATIVLTFSGQGFHADPSRDHFPSGIMPKNYQQFLALVFAVTEINKDLVLLPNITLGFHMYDNHQVERRISLISLSLFSTRGQMVPGYKCNRQDPLLSLGVGFEFSQGDRAVYSSFFRINPKEFSQYVGLVHMLLYFQWNWVGLLAPESDNGEHFISSLMPMLQEKEICLAFTEKLNSDLLAITMFKLFHSLKAWSKAEVIILFGDTSCITNVLMVMNIHEQWTKSSFCKIWILTSHWKVSAMASQNIWKDKKPFHGVLHFRDHTADVWEFSHFLLSLDPFNPQGDVFLPLWTGDLIIGGNLPLGTIISSKVPDFQNDPFMLSILSLGVDFEFFQGERRVYPSFFRINPKESAQYVSLVQLLLHFQWNWVGLLAPEDDRGERFISTLTPMLQEKEICLAFTLMLELNRFKITRNKFILNVLTWFKAEVFILFADLTVITTVIGVAYVFENIKEVSFRKVCIFTSHWKLSLGESENILQYIKFLHGVLQFRDHSGDVSEFNHFVLSLDPLNPQGDVFLPQ